MKRSTTIRLLLAGLFALALAVVFFLIGPSGGYHLVPYPEKPESEVEFLRNYREVYPIHDDFVLINIGRESGVFDTDFLRNVDALTREIGGLEVVAHVYGPTQLPTDEDREAFALRLDNLANLLRDSIEVSTRQELQGTFFGLDGKSVNLSVSFQDDLPGGSSRELTDQLIELARKYPFESVHFAGRSQDNDYFASPFPLEAMIVGLLVMLIVLLLISAWLSAREQKQYGRISKYLIAGITVISAIGIWRMSMLEFDYDFEHFFPVGDPDLEFYQNYRDQFSSDNDFFLIGIENKRGIFQERFLRDIDALTHDLDSLELVVAVTSPTTITNPVVGPLGLIQVPYVHADDPSKYAADSLRVYGSEGLVGTFFSEDGTAISINVAHQQMISKAKCDTLLGQILDIMDEYEFDEVHYAGRIHGQDYYINKMQNEVVIFVSASVLLLIFFLWFSFRAWWGVVVPIIIVLLSAVWLLGFMELTGKKIDLMTTLLPTILFVVGMSDVVHLLSKYLEELRMGKSKLEALRKSVREIGLATFLTSLTTGVGFLTLLTASILPIKQFGVYTAIGVGFAFVLAFTLFPSMLFLLPKPKISEQKLSKVFWWKRLLLLFGWVIRNQKAILAGGAVMVAVSIWGISMIKVDNFLLEDLHGDDPLLKDFQFFEEEFAGVRPFELAVWVNDTNTSLFDQQAQLELDRVERYLIDTYEVSFIFSPASVVKSAHKALNGGSAEAYKLPETQESWDKTMVQVRRVARTGKLGDFITDDQRTGRINGKIVDLGGHEISKRNVALRTFLDEELDSKYLSFRLTGTAVLIDKNNEYLANNMLTGLIIAFGIIALLVGLLYRSFVMVVISLVPNILPLLMIGGYMGLAGIDLKVSTSVIFTIAFGIAVDDTIHFVSKLRIELGKGKPLPLALKRTFISTGKAIIVTTIILCSGFVTLILSSFTSTYYIGLLISMSLAFAVVADLLLLPVLLLMFYGKGARKLSERARKRQLEREPESLEV